MPASAARIGALKSTFVALASHLPLIGLGEQVCAHIGAAARGEAFEAQESTTGGDNGVGECDRARHAVWGREEARANDEVHCSQHVGHHARRMQATFEETRR
jgi:hypothetical protein